MVGKEITMPSWLRRFSLCAFIVVLSVSFSAGADLAAGKRAYQEKDYATAFKELTPLAEKGNADAQLILGKMYWMGQGVLKDPDQAMKLFKASAMQGNADAQFFLGSIYLLPHTDIAEGVKWLRLSAEQGNQDAQWMLGKAYLQGAKELPRDPVQAEMWLWLAAKDNLEFYDKGLRAAEKEMTPEQIANGKALAAAWKPKHGLRPEDKPARDQKRADPKTQP
jgi:TPR repeat protein